jgi:aminopeptidase YwaD
VKDTAGILIMRRVLGVLGAAAAALMCATGAMAPAGPAGQAAPVAAAGRAERTLAAERTVAERVSETRMVDAVRRLVAFGPRQYGTPSNYEAAAWLASEFRKAGLEVSVREDPPRNWYQPASWQVRAVVDGTGPSDVTLKTTWPSTGAPSGKGEGVLAVETTPGAVCLTSVNPTPESTAGCAAVLVDGRASASGWPLVNRLRGTWTVPVFAVSPKETAPLREKLAAGGTVRMAFALDAKSGNSAAHTVVATLPGRDRSKYILFCAHGDSDSGGPGANDNASGVAIVLEIARAVAAAVKAGAIPPPAWDLRFASWGGEISSTREYAAGLENDPSRLQAVFNYDQSGFGSSKDALYVEPDEVPANRTIITLVRAVMGDHIGTGGFPSRAASVRTQGGTDSYVFQPRTQGATVYPAVTLYTSAWDRERALPVTEGFPPINWYADEKPGMVTVDGDAFYHSVGDTPANTTDKEPSNMGWCARVGLLSALRMMAGR